jgi:hypothetical protein
MRQVPVRLLTQCAVNTAAWVHSQLVLTWHFCVPAAFLGTQPSSITSPPAAVAETNVPELIRRLTAKGLLPFGQRDAGHMKKEEANSIKPVDFNHPETLKA